MLGRQGPHGLEEVPLRIVALVGGGGDAGGIGVAALGEARESPREQARSRSHGLNLVVNLVRKCRGNARGSGRFFWLVKQPNVVSGKWHTQTQDTIRMHSVSRGLGLFIYMYV